MDPREIRKRVDSSDWRVSPYRNAARPLYTYDDIVSDSFSSVKQLGRGANHCRLEEIALAPTYGMRYSDWHVAPDLRPYKPYQPKQNEYKLEMQKSQIGNRQLPANITTSSALPPLAPMHRRQYAVPAHKTRFENFAIYWGGRARGLDYSQPFLHEPPRDTYVINACSGLPRFIPTQPSARHSRQIMLTAY
ncbi:hypothetical protein M3Y97_00586900 [Aphelenchoides bicaudatus]|nr:hypothetical protein M3Y97_00586900 [Aphelenchoides bicaudatus]